jgi:O-antigen ligase
LPLAFCFFKIKDKRHFEILSWLFILFIAIGTSWSFGQYVGDTAATHESYLRAKVIPTWFEDDHVRFSWAVVIALILLYTIKPIFSRQKFQKVYLAIKWILIAWLIFYLHILAAKTGLICLYLAATIFLFYEQKSKWKIAGILFFLLLLPVTAYYVIPTFHNRVDYILYDFSFYSRGDYAGGFPDGARILSIKGGLKILQENFLTGTGYGDVWQTMQAWYDTYYPAIPMHDRLFPSNQWLVYGCAVGIFGILLFTLTVITPFFMTRYNKSVAWIAFHATAIICFLTEMNLEGQHGVFLYCFFAMWLMQREEANINS